MDARPLCRALTRWMVTVTIAWLGLVAASCRGTVTGPGANDETGGRFDPQAPTADPLVLVDGRIQPRVWRLSPSQYTAAVHDLLGEEVPDLGTLNDGAVVNGISNGSSNLRIDQPSVAGVFGLARDYGAWASEHADEVMRCPGSTYGTEDCARVFVTDFASRAFRRPATDEEIDALVGLFAQGAELDVPTGVGAIVHSVLASPSFLYRHEIGEPDPANASRRLLTQFEIAGLLSMMLTNRRPDDELLTAAEAGTLSDPAVREAHARRLFGQSGAVFHEFFDQWLDLGRLEQVAKSPDAYPGFDGALAAQMRAETNRFIDGVLVEGSGRLPDLLTASHTWVGPDLAMLYGVEHPGGGVVRVELPPEERAGLLTQAAWLTVHAQASDSSVEKRGAYVWRSLLCEHMDPPPASAMATIQRLMMQGLGKREMIEARRQNASCWACHQYTDPIGLGLERYDGVGGFRTTQDSMPIDATGTVPTFGSFDGGVELAHLLAESERTQACFARRLAQYTAGLDLGGPSTTEWVHTSFQAFVDDDLRVEGLIAAFVRDPRFVERQILEEE